ncbi:hypothetical protein [Altererythrobacter sp. Root672]|uniref:hypothetical protein n=1 Tax=Altererythrobacter sp. Root672 TaxID=1736584 RepID=UPI0006F3C058|nr:hypothetical protein [Altererythrobacter sp. Root672]KRA82834.1 hypothetical protein ASD76_01710 [Altererythrobacter sp. Root672]
MTNFSRSLVLGCSVLALAACGPEDIASPGTGGNITINNPPAPTPSPTPTPTAPALVTPAAGCPTISDPQGLTNSGTITGPTGEWRICDLPRVVRASSTLPRLPGVLYRLNGRVDVGCDGGFTAPTAGAPFATSTVGCPTATLTSDTAVRLTIEPGVVIYGGTGQSWLAVNRGNSISAVGTATQPIVFTSRDNVQGLETETSQGKWGGVVLMGRAVTTDCTTGSVAAGTCERQTEGAPDPARFGGADDTYNAGRLSFVQIRYSGFVLGSNVELQSLTTEAVGSGTIIDHIQSHNSSDDGAEFFGGKFNMKYYIATGADDDSLDVDTGARVDVQYALLLQRDANGDALFEIDSNGNEADTPRTNLKVANFTAIQRQASVNNDNNDQASALFRGNSDITLVNGLIISPNNECVRMHGTGAAGQRTTLTARSVALQCNATKFIGSGTAGVAFTAGDVAAVFAGNNNSDAFTNTLTGLFINGANETALVATDPKTISSFFDSTTWAGAVRNSTDTWYAGWTCNSAIADFGTGNSGACTTLPKIV